MEQITGFKNAEFGVLRTIEVDDKILFCASDVARALGYSNPNKAINDHCRAITKRDTPISGKMQEINYITEGDVYRLIVRSKLPSAEKFETWVFDEVLPSIRKHGAYMTEQTVEKALADPDFLIRLATELKQEQEKRKSLESQMQADKPKVIFADSVTTSNTCILVGELAKILKGNGVNIGQNRLFEWLRENGYLVNRKGTDYNTPTQKSMDLGLFKIKETTVIRSDGHIQISKTPKITGKGQIYFTNKFLKG
jgi:anti-repressor protein